ncbi:unnamed protein product [Rotaria sordida]|uniref:Nuclear speckle splicing regulatory protein 1 N-terminal domain-containing protein n=1 Tax=Rotaria sordida TaxID=392033 RepID=A0A818WJA3_9BILA|nr:unnamed protein product [Rotaria sordida]CAF1280176.1 unnamed protein product [Rotaria sordida]CAF1373591.1 unnamed protein product [Rotaria sordida]CAF1373705.1 unnamed protein product [Rotaria sordida]CAF1385092.1 unnamed protein product [Rotaria sordida]
MSTDDNLSTSKRPFGLSLPSKPKSKTTTTTTTLTPINRSCLAAAAFSLDDDDDIEPTSSSIKTNKFPTSTRLKLNPKAQRDIEEALEQDPNIYSYDEVYEQVSSTVQQEQKREEKKRLERETNIFRQPKYVAGLLEKSKQREKEFERVQERRIQREREQEGDLYADKEVFVTSAYKAKLAERQADLEREKLEDKREALLNVLQQDNMDAFYRFQFKVRTGDVTILEESEKIKNEPSESIQKESSTNRQLRSRTTNDDDQMEINSSNDNDNMYVRAREKHTRSIQREHHHQDINNDEVIIDELPKSTQKNTTVKIRRINDEKTQEFDDEQIAMGVGGSNKKNKIKKDKNEKLINTKENDLLINMPIALEKKRQAEETRIERIRRLCEKRTIGDIFDMAQQDYYERQQKRNLFKDYIEKSES